MIKNIILIAILIISVSCVSKKKANKPLPDNFYECWTSSYEENDDKGIILNYRPCKYKEFKPSRFRHTMVFEKDGKCTFLQVSPSDAHFEVVGTWAYEKGTEWIIILNEKKELAFKFKIESIEKDLMKIITPDRSSK